ncbi:acyltransferase family protein [Nocardioides gilvus]|uniref:acyltransferase family protein n=1 Tax=Nocardioides gilvus TaxID=1735589 RepID=UPI000D742204|nr:acyltransferase [Nocardioides gilvus]
MAATDATVTDPTSREVRDAQISSLTGMRGFAALMVVLVHTAGKTEYPWLGVHGYGPIALFVLSGFLLYRPFGRWIMGWAPRPSLPGFAIRRVLRIFPAYWVTLHVWYFIYPKAVPDTFGEWIRDLTLVNTLQFFELTVGLEQAWSMGVELTWYLALPILAIVLHGVVPRVPERHRLKAHVGILVAIFPVSVAYLAWAHQQDVWDSAGMWLPRYLICFAFGALIGLMMDAERAGATDITRGRKIMTDPWLLPMLALVFAAVAISEWSGPVSFTKLTLTQEYVRDGAGLGLAGTLLIISVFSGPGAPLVRLLSSRVMQATGRWSYGIYLWHLPVITILAEDVTFQEGPQGLFFRLLWLLPIAYLLGAMSYAWVETPAMQWAKHLSKPYDGTAKTGGRRRSDIGPVVSEAPEMRDAVASEAPYSPDQSPSVDAAAPRDDSRGGPGAVQ